LPPVLDEYVSRSRVADEPMDQPLHDEDISWYTNELNVEKTRRGPQQQEVFPEDVSTFVGEYSSAQDKGRRQRQQLDPADASVYVGETTPALKHAQKTQTTQKKRKAPVTQEIARGDNDPKSQAIKNRIEAIQGLTRDEAIGMEYMNNDNQPVLYLSKDFRYDVRLGYITVS